MTELVWHLWRIKYYRPVNQGNQMNPNSQLTQVKFQKKIQKISPREKYRRFNSNFCNAKQNNEKNNFSYP